MNQTIERRIPRRAVLAFIALTGDESLMAKTVEFREYRRSGKDWHVIELTVESEAAVRFWAEVFGHDPAVFRRSDHVRDDGSRWTHYSSQHDGWRGFITEVNASVDEPAAALSELDDATAGQLRQLAEVTG